MDDQTTPTPLACTLATDKQRLEIKQIRNEIIPKILMRQQTKNGLQLIFATETKLQNNIEKLIRLDNGCCTFLNHQIEKTDKKIIWKIESEGAGIPLAQNYLLEQITVQKSWFTNMGFKTGAILAVCGFACSAPVIFGAVGVGFAGFGLGALGLEITTLGAIVVVAGIYWLYKKKKIQLTKGLKNENRCGC